MYICLENVIYKNNTMSRYKILFGYRFKPEGFVALEKDFDLTYPEREHFRKEDIIERIADYDVLVPNFSFMTDKDVIDNAPRLRLIANFGVGYNNIDVEYATTKGIAVANTPQSVLEPTAELCFGILCATARNIGFYNNKLRTPEGLSWGLYDNPGVAMYGKTLGIIGMGRIGQAVARRAIASGMKIIYHNRHRLDQTIEKQYDAEYVSFDKLIETSDFISLNAPATQETAQMIGEKEFARMKSSAILINTARGSLVDENALIKALRNKEIFAAGLDVYPKEPKINPELLALDNVLLCPHAGTQTIEGRLDMQREVSENIINFFKGLPFAKVN